MKKIILSLDAYGWIKYCSGLILENSSEYRIMLIYKERGEDGIVGYKKLCMEAIAAQRRHDIARIGRKLGIKSIINLNYEHFIDEDHLVMNLKLESTFGKVSELYCPYNEVLSPILDKIAKEIGVETFYFGNNINRKEKKIVDTSKFSSKLQDIQTAMIGIPDTSYLEFPLIENFY